MMLSEGYLAKSLETMDRKKMAAAGDGFEIFTLMALEGMSTLLQTVFSQEGRDTAEEMSKNHITYLAHVIGHVQFKERFEYPRVVKINSPMWTKLIHIRQLSIDWCEDFPWEHGGDLDELLEVTMAKINPLDTFYGENYIANEEGLLISGDDLLVFVDPFETVEGTRKRIIPRDLATRYARAARLKSAVLRNGAWGWNPIAISNAAVEVARPVPNQGVFVYASSTVLELRWTNHFLKGQDTLSPGKGMRADKDLQSPSPLDLILDSLAANESARPPPGPSVFVHSSSGKAESRCTDSFKGGYASCKSMLGTPNTQLPSIPDPDCFTIGGSVSSRSDEPDKLESLRTDKPGSRSPDKPDSPDDSDSLQISWEATIKFRTGDATIPVANADMDLQRKIFSTMKNVWETEKTEDPDVERFTHALNMARMREESIARSDALRSETVRVAEHLSPWIGDSLM
jgi:hypothetical protein